MTSRRPRSSRCISAGEFGKRPGRRSTPTPRRRFTRSTGTPALQRGWKDFYDKGGAHCLSTGTPRPTPSIRAASFEGEKQAEFFTWLYDLEYDKMGLPRPDLVLLPRYADRACASAAAKSAIRRALATRRHSRARRAVSGPVPRDGASGGKVLRLDAHFLRRRTGVSARLRTFTKKFTGTLRPVWRNKNGML